MWRVIPSMKVCFSGALHFAGKTTNSLIYSTAKRTFITDMISKVKGALGSTQKKKDQDNRYGKVDKMIDEAIPTTGVMSFITKKIWKSIGHKALDEFKRKNKDIEDVLDIAEDKILEDSRVIKSFGDDVQVGQTTNMYSAPILFEREADEDIQLTVQLQGRRSTGTAQIFAFKYEKRNPMHKLEKDKLVIYKIIVSDGFNDFSVVNKDPNSHLPSSENDSRGESKPRKVVIDIKGKDIK